MGDIFDGFTTEEKWLSLSSGIANDSLGPDGTTFAISVGPLNIQPNQSVMVGFAIIKGNNLMDLKNLSSVARNKYNSVGVKQISELLPKKYELMQNYPNPFNPATNIKFAIPENDYVNIRIYDILGREIMTLVNEKLNPGYYEFNFNGASLSSGLYFYRMTTNKYSDIKRMILVK
ncbi:MAG: T9SS type A sorting domain-containing protein [Ignavibacteria bacterium]|jgi:hypothetical protein